MIHDELAVSGDGTSVRVAATYTVERGLITRVAFGPAKPGDAAAAP